MLKQIIEPIKELQTRQCNKLGLFGNGNINDVSYNNNETSLGKEETIIISVIGNGIQTPSEKIDEVIGVWPNTNMKQGESIKCHRMLC